MEYGSEDLDRFAELEAQIEKEQRELEDKRARRLTATSYLVSNIDDLTYSQFTATRKDFEPMGKDRLDEMER